MLPFSDRLFKAELRIASLLDGTRGIPRWSQNANLSESRRYDDIQGTENRFRIRCPSLLLSYACLSRWIWVNLLLSDSLGLTCSSCFVEQAGNTPLIVAAQADGTGALVKELLAARASLESVGGSGQTALIAASASARAGAVRELLAAKASTSSQGGKVCLHFWGDPGQRASNPRLRFQRVARGGALSSAPSRTAAH